MSDGIGASLEVLAQSAEQGSVESMHLLGKHFFECGDHVQAEHWYQKAIDLGNIDSMVNLGVVYFTAKRYEEASFWFKKASELGDSGGMYNMAVLLNETGNNEDSIDWYHKAIDAGDEDATHNLRILLLELGLVEDASKLSLTKEIVDFVAKSYVDASDSEDSFWEKHYIGGIYAFGASLGHIEILDKGKQTLLETYSALIFPMKTLPSEDFEITPDLVSYLFEQYELQDLRACYDFDGEVLEILTRFDQGKDLSMDDEIALVACRKYLDDAK